MQHELQSVIKEIYSSLDIHKSIIKKIKTVLGCVSIISFLISALMWYNNAKSIQNIGKDFDVEIRKLAEKYDMSNIDEYRLELEIFLEEDKYSKVKGLILYVADKEDGNISLSSLGVNADMVYEKEVNYYNVSNFTSHLAYNEKDFLDKYGNIVNPDIFLEYFFYYESKTLI
nr:hypothetical protein [uncultured Romboutsia sp.]